MVSPRRSAVALTALALWASAGLSGCQFAPPAWTFDGTQQVIALPGENIAAIDRQWRQRLAMIPEDLRITDDSRCFYQVQNGRDDRGNEVIRVGKQVLCGPYRPIGSNATLWDHATVVYSAERREVSLAPGGFTPGGVELGTRGARPDGKVPRLDIAVPEPDSPVAAVGDVVAAGQQDAPTMRPLAEGLRVPGAEYTFAVGTAERLGSVAGRRTAPADSSFLVLTVTRAPGSRDLGKPATVSVIADGKVFPVGPADQLPQVGIALPAGAREVALGLTFDGRTQTVDVATGTRSSVVAGLYAEPRSDVSVPPPFNHGKDATLGNRVSATLSATVTATPWDPTLGWAPEGECWARIHAQVSVQTLTFLGPTWDEDYELSALSPGLSAAGGVPARSVSATRTGPRSGELTIVVPIPTTAGGTPVTLSAKVTGSKPEGSTTDNPATMEQEIVFPVTVTVL